MKRITLNAIVICLALTAPQALSTDVTAQKPADRGPQLKWENFRRSASESPESYRLSDDDIIMMKFIENVVPKDEVEFVFESGLNVTWWKGIEVVYTAPPRPGPLPIAIEFPWDNPHRHILNSLYTQDADHGPKSMRVKLNALSARPHTLVFLKAKAFGAHTPMYYLPLYQQIGTQRWQADTSKLAGRRITFTWEKD